jgi:lipid A 4'-phosphatase
MKRYRWFMLFALLTLVFTGLFPTLDIRLQRLFFDQHTHLFWGNTQEWCRVVSKILVPWLVALYAMSGFFLLGRGYQQHHQASLRAGLLILLTLIVGAGLVTNVLFKNHWGRARPSQVEFFSGHLPYSPPLLLSGACERNCSFVSGDASAGFSFFALAVAYPRRYWYWFSLAALLGGFLGVVRILQGAHFVSDVLFAGLFMHGTATVLGIGLDRFSATPFGVFLGRTIRSMRFFDSKQNLIEKK